MSLRPSTDSPSINSNTPEQLPSALTQTSLPQPAQHGEHSDQHSLPTDEPPIQAQSDPASSAPSSPEPERDAAIENDKAIAQALNEAALVVDDEERHRADGDALAREVAQAVLAPTPDGEWPPTLEQWHESRGHRGHAPGGSGSSAMRGAAAVAAAASSSRAARRPSRTVLALTSTPRTHSDAETGELTMAHTSKAQELPQEILMRLFAFLDPFGLATVALVCRSWAKVATDDATWRGAFAIYFGLDWGSDEIRSPFRLSGLGAQSAAPAAEELTSRAAHGEAGAQARSVMLRRLRPAKWKQEFIARWELARRWRKTKTQPISTNPSIATISQLAFAPSSSTHASSFLLSASLAYGVACRSDPFTGRRISMGFLDASGNTNGAGIGNPNVEFAPDVTAIVMGADARSIVWGFRTGHVSLTLLSKQGTNPRGLVRSLRFDEAQRHRGGVTDIALPLAAGHEGGARSVVRSPARMAQHLSEMGELAATLVTAGADGTVRLWAWPLEKLHGTAGGSGGVNAAAGLGGGAGSGPFRKFPLWTGASADGCPPPSTGQRPPQPAFVKVAFNPVLGVVVAAVADGTVIVWSNLNVSRLVAAPASAFGTNSGPTSLADAADPAISDWRKEVQEMYGAVRVTRLVIDSLTTRIASLEIAAPSTRRVGDTKTDEVSILVHREEDSVLHRFDLILRAPAASTKAAVSDEPRQPWERDEYPKIRAIKYALPGSEMPITCIRTDFDTLSASDRSKNEVNVFSSSSSAEQTPATRSPSLLPTTPSRRVSGRISGGGASSLAGGRDPVRFSLPVSAAYSEGVRVDDRGLYAERPFLVAGNAGGQVMVWDWDWGVAEDKAYAISGLAPHPSALNPNPERSGLRVPVSATISPSMGFAAHPSSAISALDLTPLALVVGTVDGTLKVFNSLNGELIRVFNDKAASRHPARMLAEGQLTDEQAAQFYVRQIIAGEESVVAAIGPHVIAWRTDALIAGGKGRAGGPHAANNGLGLGAGKKVGPKARSQRAASWQTKYQANAELQADVKESAVQLRRESRERQLGYERMRWATGPPELGGLDDEEALEYAIILSREAEEQGHSGGRREAGRDLGIGTSSSAAAMRAGPGAGQDSVANEFDLDAALAQYDDDDHFRSRRERDRSPPPAAGSSDDGSGGAGKASSSTTPSPLSSPHLRGVSTPSRAWEILNSAGSATQATTPDRWGAASKVRTVSVPRSARRIPPSLSAAGSFSAAPASAAAAASTSVSLSSSPSPASAAGGPGMLSLQQRLMSDADSARRVEQEVEEEWPSVSPPSSSLTSRSPPLGAWSMGSAGLSVPAHTGTGAGATWASYGSIAAAADPSPRSRARSRRIATEEDDDGMDDDLRFALELSMAEEASRQASFAAATATGAEADGHPSV
ncbi:hypothetical protein V8E36_008601 [Tilletia maclaganii]